MSLERQLREAVEKKLEESERMRGTPVSDILNDHKQINRLRSEPDSTLKSKIT